MVLQSITQACLNALGERRTPQGTSREIHTKPDENITRHILIVNLINVSLLLKESVENYGITKSL
jgi:hypothetical protein